MQSRVAIHEAGHAVMAIILDDDVESVSVIPGEGYLGLCAGGQSVLDFLHTLSESVEPNPFDDPAGYEEYNRRYGRYLDNPDEYHRRRIMTFFAGGICETLHLGDVETEGCNSDHEKAVDHLYVISGGPENVERLAAELAEVTQRRLAAQDVRAAVKAVAAALDEQRTISGEQAKAIVENAMGLDANNLTKSVAVEIEPMEASS